jgi:hypothetical protein
LHVFVDGALGVEVYGLDALVDGYEIVFGLMVYHWWMLSMVNR